MSRRTIFLILASTLAAMTAANAPQYSDARKFLRTCLDRSHPAHEPNCNSYQCYVRTHSLDLRQLDRMLCSRNSDCSVTGSNSGMVCVSYGGSAAFCECPMHSAFNATSCGCQKASICPREAGARPANAGGRRVACHNGMACADGSCSCSDLSESLFEPQSRLCVLPRSVEAIASENAASEAAAAGGASSTSSMTVVLVILFLCVVLAAIAVGVYVMTENMTCARGEYECDDPKERMAHEAASMGLESRSRSKVPEGQTVLSRDAHVAAWDLPSLDYLSEEQTMKYLRRHHKNLEDGSSTSTSDSEVRHEGDSPVPSSGSLPESERQQHVNRAFESQEENGMKYV